MPPIIHPAVVHIPIGLLTVYSILEFVRFKKVLAQPYWFYIKAILVIFGTLGTFVALQTGELIEDLFQSSLMETHSTFATATTIVYGIIAGAYLVLWIEVDAANWKFLRLGGVDKLWKVLTVLSRIILKPWLVVLLSLLALSLLTITGALGGALVHGPEVDPVVSFVYHLFF